MIVRTITPGDRLDDDEAALLLYPGQVVKLGPLGAAVTELATDPIDLHSLSTELEQRFGRPETGTTAEATHAAVTALIESGVLERLDDPSTPAEEPA